VHAQSTRPERTALMLERAGSYDGPLVPVTQVASVSASASAYPVSDHHYHRRLSSTNHHACFSTAPEPYCHDPLQPGKANTLCPSTLEQLATTYQLPDFMEIRDAYYARDESTISFSHSSGEREGRGNIYRGNMCCALASAASHFPLPPHKACARLPLAAL
jgi:hypothetical protein